MTYFIQMLQIAAEEAWVVIASKSYRNLLGLEDFHAFRTRSWHDGWCGPKTEPSITHCAIPT